MAGFLLGQGVEFGGDVSGFGGADPLENRTRLAQSGFSLGGAAAGQGATAQADQGVSLHGLWIFGGTTEIQKEIIARGLGL